MEYDSVGRRGKGELNGENQGRSKGGNTRRENPILTSLTPIL